MIGPNAPPSPSGAMMADAGLRRDAVGLREVLIHIDEAPAETVAHR